MAALAQQTKPNFLLSRFKAFLVFQKFNHNTYSKDKHREQHSANMGSGSVVDAGEIDFSKWRKLYSRDFGISNSLIPAYAWTVLKSLQSGGFEAYLVGGCVRDLILNKIPKDFDVITTARLPQIKRRFHRAIIVGRRFPICRVHVNGSIVEVSSFDTRAKPTGASEKLSVPKMPKKFHQKDFILWKDSMHRDFTVNSLFFDPSVNTIYDYADAIVDLKSLQLRTLVPAHLSFEEDCARILRGLRLAARLKLSFSKEIEIAMHKLSPSIMILNKSRLMMEVNYMLSYGAAEPSLSLLQRYSILEMLLPFHAAHLAQQSNKQLSESSVMLMKLFSSLDQLVTCDRPSHDSLWVALLAFHLALITDPQGAFVVLTFASVLYHGNWKEGVNFARRHSDAASIYAPEISDSQGSISDDELVERVTELAVLVQNSLDILTDKDSLQEAMSKFPGSPCSGLVFVSKNMRKVVEVIFDVLIGDVRSLKTRRNSFEIDYTLLGKGQTRETRFVLGKVILDTIAPGVIPGSEVIKHTLVKIDAQLSKNAPKENMGGNVKFKKRKFVCEDDNQPNASSEIKHNRDEKLNTVIAKQSKEKAVEKHDNESLSQKLDNGDAVTKKKSKVEQSELPQNGTRTEIKHNRDEKRITVIAKQSKEKAVEKHDNESLSQKLDNGDAVTKKKSKGEQSELPQNGTRMVLEAVKHPMPSHKKEQKRGNKYQQTSANHLKLIHNVDNGATTKQHKLKEKRDSSQEQKEEKSESLHSRKHDLKGGKLASDEKSKPKAGNQTLSDLFRR
ncbi:hypothetical protein KY290_016108 [Solanum tuberosum]|uniref:Poly(A) polymerase n=1 Tax=Solanum tuberosum TaxID=4113 RepID=A0ABQ7VX07_SOLTU|nr:hypothetical protein KY285_015435 [Solanum tuberosum]KAH0772127.1 hypothetical protein KY290_016108 [Solanum tuberosum]